ncbi:MAG: hypothetical protein U9R34_00315 [Nanoarchaeota archaeon]|nr:hypothetical protein [Nanoarchaeota archaeon]
MEIHENKSIKGFQVKFHLILIEIILSKHFSETYKGGIIMSLEVIYVLKITCVCSWLLVLSTFIFKKILIKKTKDVQFVEEEQKQKKSPFHKLKKVMFILLYVYVGCVILGCLTSWYLGKVPEINWKTDLLVIFGIFIPGIIFSKICEGIEGLMQGKAKILEKGGNGT